MSAAGLQARQIHALYADHHGWLHAWLCRKLGNACDAADLAHDTFLRLMLSRSLPANLGKEPRALLTHVARGLVIDHWRRQDVEAAYLDALSHLPAAESPSPETRLAVVEALCKVEAMLRGLPARTRDVFLLAQLDGLTYREIAERRGMAPITVKRHMRTAFAACLALA